MGIDVIDTIGYLQNTFPIVFAKRDRFDPADVRAVPDRMFGFDALRVFSGPLSEGFALRVSSLCFLGPLVDHGEGPACYRRLAGDGAMEPAAHPVPPAPGCAWGRVDR